MKSYSNMNIKEKIAYDCGGTQLIDDVNHPMRRAFRCWLDGSYNGEGHYITNCEFVKRNYDNYKQMRMFVINEFVKFIAREYDCSYGHAQSCIVQAISKDNLARLNDWLIEDAADLVADYIQEQKEEEE